MVTSLPIVTTPSQSQETHKSSPTEVSAILDIAVDDLLTMFTIKRELVPRRASPDGQLLDKKLYCLHQAVTEFYDELKRTTLSGDGDMDATSSSTEVSPDREEDSDSDYDVDDTLINAYIEQEDLLSNSSSSSRQPPPSASTTPSILTTGPVSGVSHPRILAVTPPLATLSSDVATASSNIATLSLDTPSDPSPSDNPPPYLAHITTRLTHPPDPSVYFILFSTPLSGGETPYYPAPNFTLRGSASPGARWIAIYKGTSVGVVYNWYNAKTFVIGVPNSYYKGFATCMEACQAFWRKHALHEVEILVR